MKARSDEYLISQIGSASSNRSKEDNKKRAATE